MCAAFSCKQDEKHLLANSVWQTVHIFSGRWINLAKCSTVVWQNSVISQLLKLNINLLAKRYALATFYLAQKVW